jgi:hypothetical protein
VSVTERRFDASANGVLCPMPAGTHAGGCYRVREREGERESERARERERDLTAAHKPAFANGLLCPMPAGTRPGMRKVNVKLPGERNSNSHGARPVHQIITIIKWIRTSGLSIKKSLSREWGVEFTVHTFGFRVEAQGLMFRDSGFGIRVSVFGFRYSVFGIWVSEPAVSNTGMTTWSGAAWSSNSRRVSLALSIGA